MSRMGAGEYALELWMLRSSRASPTPARSPSIMRLTNSLSTPLRPSMGSSASTGALRSSTRIPLKRSVTFLGLSPDHVPVPLYAWHKPGTTKVYLSILLYPAVEVDLETQEQRWMRGMVGGGQMAGDPSLRASMYRHAL